MPEYPETEVERLDRIIEEIESFRDRFELLVERAVDRKTNEQARQLRVSQDRAAAFEKSRDALTELINGVDGYKAQIQRREVEVGNYERAAQAERERYLSAMEHIRVLETDLKKANAVLNESIQKDSLADAILTINDVMTRVTEALLGAGSGIKAGAEVRRQMAVKYSLEHDTEHGAVMFEDAASALIAQDQEAWPPQFGTETYFDLIERPQVARAHAIALLAVAYDITRKEQDDA